MNYFNLMMNEVVFHHKPTFDEVRYHIRPYWKNHFTTATIEQLASWIETGHSFYANVLDYRLNTKMKAKEPTKPSTALNGTCYVPTATTLISVDVDHGNYTLEELKACIRSVPHALIYKTMSYTEEKKKYRVLFIANRPFQDEAEFRLVQTSLIYLFAHPFAHRMEQLNQKVDFSVKDPARISFPGQVIREEVYDRTFDLDLFIRQCCQLDTLTLVNEFIYRWKIEEKRREALAEGVEFDETIAQTQIKAPQRAKTEEERQEVVQTLIHGLERYKQSHDLPLMMEFNRTIEWVNQLPLQELLNEVLGLPFCCYLPDHHDTDPSAVILLNEAGQTRYFCHGCGEGHSLSNFDFIEEILITKFGYDRFNVIKFIFEALDIRLNSEYRNEALMRLQLIRDFLNEWEDDDPVKQLLIRRNLFTTYELIVNLASTKVGLQPTTLDKTNLNPSFFASAVHLNYQMVKVRGIRTGHSNAEKTADKLTELANLGLIKKIDDDRLDPQFLAKSETYRQQLMAKEFEVEGKKGNTRRRVSYFEIPMLSHRLLKEVATFWAYEKSLGMKVKARSARAVRHTHGEEKAKEVLPQGRLEDTKIEKRFIKALEKAIEVCLTQKGYFTEKQLIAQIDRQQNIPLAIKKKNPDGSVQVVKSAAKRKQELLPTYLPEQVAKRKLKKGTVNKGTRQQFEIPSSISSSTTIYY